MDDSGSQLFEARVSDGLSEEKNRKTKLDSKKIKETHFQN